MLKNWFFGKKEETNDVFQKMIEKIINLIIKHESEFILGKHQLSLTSKFLLHFEQELKTQSSLEESISIAYKKIHIIDNFFYRLKSIRIIGTRQDIDSKLNLTSFSSLICIELENFTGELVKSLDICRSQIKSLIFRRCYFEESIESLFTSENSFPLLQYLAIFSCNLREINVSVFPSSLRKLDLSWNYLNEFDIKNLMHITCLDLSFNFLKQLPLFYPDSPITNSLKILRIRCNLISKFNGLEYLGALNELDLCYNCIVCCKDFLHRISYCLNLEKLLITGNPIEHSPKLIQQLVGILPKLKFYNGRALETIRECQEMLFKVKRDSFMNKMEISSMLRAQNVRNIRENNQKAYVSPRVVINESDEDFETLDQDSFSDNQKLLCIENLKPIMNLPDFSESPLDALAGSCFNESLASSSAKCETVTNNDVDDDDHEKFEEESDDDIAVIRNGFEHKWTDNDIENSEEMFLVKNKDDVLVFLYVKDDIIYEKDCISGIVKISHDLNILTKVEDEQDTLLLKLLFNSEITNKQQVYYLFEDRESLKMFKDQYISHFMQKREVYEGKAAVYKIS